MQKNRTEQFASSSVLVLAAKEKLRISWEPEITWDNLRLTWEEPEKNLRVTWALPGNNEGKSIAHSLFLTQVVGNSWFQTCLDLESHILIHQEAEGKAYKCHLCDSKFRQKIYLSIHLKRKKHREETAIDTSGENKWKDDFLLLSKLENKANTYKSRARHEQSKMTFIDSRWHKMTQDDIKRPKMTEMTIWLKWLILT